MIGGSFMGRGGGGVWGIGNSPPPYPKPLKLRFKQLLSPKALKKWFLQTFSSSVELHFLRRRFRKKIWCYRLILETSGNTKRYTLIQGVKN